LNKHLDNKRKFHTLDGIRGIAALIVCMKHAHGFFLHSGTFQEGYLAVDIFFAMSGVVLANAYEQRLKTGLSALRFAWIRLVRFYPLYALGFGLSLACLWGHFFGFPMDHLNVLIPLAILLLPNVAGFAHGSPFPLNVPAWTLLYELWVNVLYGKFISLLRTRNLVIIVALSSVGLIAGEHFYPLHSMDFGWTQRSFPFGSFRVAYSYFLGVIIYRKYAARGFPQLSRHSQPAAWALLALLAALLLSVPAAPVQAYFDFVCVAVVLPAIVYAALHFEPVGYTRNICKFLGVISYPVYAIHWPLEILINGEFKKLTGVSLDNYAPYSGIVFIALLMLLCWALNSLYDVKIREFVLAKTGSKPRRVSGRLAAQALDTGGAGMFTAVQPLLPLSETGPRSRP
jgi:peptidoglycan/LPS O-acetylase OafA/YrhL